MVEMIKENLDQALVWAIKAREEAENGMDGEESALLAGWKDALQRLRNGEGLVTR